MHPIQNLRQKDLALRAVLARRGQDIDWPWFDNHEAPHRAPSQRANKSHRA